MCLRRLVQSFRAVRWSSALQTEDYQRLRLRLLGIEITVLTLTFIGTFLYVLGTRMAMSALLGNTLFVLMLLCALVGLPLMLLVIVQVVKIDLARLRDFNIPAPRALGILVAAFAVLMALSVADTKHGTNLTLWYGLVWTVAYSLYSYYVFFVTPANSTRYAVAAPFAAPAGNNERIFQFLFQIAVWFNLLFEPLSYAIQN